MIEMAPPLPPHAHHYVIRVRCRSCCSPLPPLVWFSMGIVSWKSTSFVCLSLLYTGSLTVYVIQIACLVLWVVNRSGSPPYTPNSTNLPDPCAQNPLCPCSGTHQHNSGLQIRVTNQSFSFYTPKLGDVHLIVEIQTNNHLLKFLLQLFCNCERILTICI